MKKQYARARLFKIFVYFLFVTLSAVVLFPVIYTVCNSFMSGREIAKYYSGAVDNSHMAMLHFIPDVFSFDAYYQIFLRRPDYLIKFINSLAMCGLILLGQAVISCMGGFAFAKYSFKGRNALFFVIIILMMMPVQVMLVPNYIVLDKLRLLDTMAALILPAMFLPFGTFLMTQIFKGIPNEIIEAARLDGANTCGVLTRILIPSGKAGLISMLLLVFIDNWNMTEQPVVFIKDSMKWPLSVFLAYVNAENFTLSFACGIMAMLPVLLLFLFYQEELVQGIEFSGIK